MAVAIALAVRLTLLALFSHSTSFAGVTLNYGETARHLAAGHGYVQGSTLAMQREVESGGRLLDPEDFRNHPDAQAYEPTMYRLPGYSLLLAATFRLFGHERYIYLQVLQAIVDSVAGTLLVAWLGSAVFTAGTGLLAAILYAVSPLARTSVYPLPDAFLSVFILAATACALQYVRTGRARWALLLGLDLGVAAYFRLESAVLLVPAFTVAVAIAAASVGRGLKTLALSGLVAGLCLLPWSMRNHRVFGTWRAGPVQAGGLLWEGIGEYPNSLGATASDRALYEYEAAHGHEPRTPEADRFVVRQVMGYIRSHPGEFAGMVLRRIVRTLVFQGGRPGWTLTAAATRPPGAVSKQSLSRLLLTTYRVVSFLAVVAGFWLGRKVWRYSLLLLAAPLAFIVPHWFVIVEVRHILIAMGSCAVLAARAIANRFPRSIGGRSGSGLY